MTKKQIRLIKDLILFSKSNELYNEAYNFVVKELKAEINKEVKKWQKTD